MNTQIEIIFDGIPAEDSVFTFHDSYTGTNYIMTFKDPRVNLYECSRETENNKTSIQAAYYVDAFNSDYNIGLIFSTNKGANTVIITANNIYSQFSIITPNAQITTEITNSAAVTPISVDSITFAAATIGTICDDVKISINTDVQADTIVFPYNGVVNSNPHVFEWPRQDVAVKFLLSLGTSSTVLQYIRIPKLLTSYLTIDILGTPGDAVVKVNTIYPLLGSAVILEYSFGDNLNYASSNTFTGVPDGAFDIYVRDQFGCEVMLSGVVDEFNANLIDYDPLVIISKLNPLGFKEVQTIENCGQRRNNENSLSYELQTPLNNRDFIQLFQQCDNPKTQIQSNYETNTTVLLDEDDNEVGLVSTKVTENTDIKDARDGYINLLANNQIGIYFGSGLTYDPLTLLADGGSYNLGSFLMDWINVDDWINVEGHGWFRIIALNLPTQSHNFYNVVIDADNTSLGFVQDESFKISTVYNAVDYERYEFTVDTSALSGYYRVRIDNTDTKTNFPARQFLSEWLFISETVDTPHHLIEYYNSENNEINFATAITFSIRIPYILPLRFFTDNEQDIYITDTQSVLLTNTAREFYKFAPKPIPMNAARQLVLILSQDRIQVDGLNYIGQDIEVNEIGSTNLYLVTATLIRSDYVFENTKGFSLAEILLPEGAPIEINDNSDGLLLI